MTLGKNSRGYHYILANLVSNNKAAPMGNEQDLLFFFLLLLHVMELRCCMHNKWMFLYQACKCFICCIRRACSVCCSYLIHHNLAAGRRCLFSSVNVLSDKLMSCAMNKQHLTFLSIFGEQPSLPPSLGGVGGVFI